MDSRLVSWLPQLRVLDISNNFIISLEERFFNSIITSPELTHLYMHGRQIF
jgi:hypothetical protein